MILLNISRTTNGLYRGIEGSEKILADKKYWSDIVFVFVDNLIDVLMINQIDRKDEAVYLMGYDSYGLLPFIIKALVSLRFHNISYDDKIYDYRLVAKTIDPEEILNSGIVPRLIGSHFSIDEKKELNQFKSEVASRCLNYATFWSNPLLFTTKT